MSPAAVSIASSGPTPIAVLLVDDDVELTSLLAQYLGREGFDAHAVHDGESGVLAANSGRYAIAVLDVMMPGMSGMEVLRRIRSTSRLPILMLTARGDNIDRIVGLDMGADDYIPKPCTPGELVARLRAVLRRTLPTTDAGDRESGRQGPGQVTFGALELSPGSRTALWQGKPLELTGTEFSLLDVLARHGGQLITRQEISRLAFDRPLERFDRRIDVHISSIRQKLGVRPDGQSWIHSVRGMGYQLLAA